MDSIMIKLEDLVSMVKELQNYDETLEFVRVSILPKDEVDGETIPATLEFSALLCRDEWSSGYVDFDGIEEVQFEEE